MGCLGRFARFPASSHILQSSRPIGSSELLASMSCVPFLLLPIGGAVAGATALASHSQNAMFFFFPDLPPCCRHLRRCRVSFPKESDDRRPLAQDESASVSLVPARGWWWWGRQKADEPRPLPSTPARRIDDASIRRLGST